MKQRIYQILKIILRMSWHKFIYYNFFCRKINREKHKYIIPYRGSAIRLKKGASINLMGNLYLNYNRQVGMIEKCYLRLGENSILKVKTTAKFNYNNIVIIEPNGCLEIDSMGANAGCIILCSNSIIIGSGVMLGWNVTVMDSDGHFVGYGKNESRKNARPIVIEDHVWLCSGSMVMKGSKIGKGAIIGAGSFITGRIKSGVVTSPMPSKVICEKVTWQK